MDYTERVQAAIDFMEEHLQEKMTLSVVADVAGFSEYHFHRIFHGMIGESVADYLRKRRLAEAAAILRQTSLDVREIALRSQFENQESFTRSFKKMFGINPLQFRKNPEVNPGYHKRRINKDMIKHLQEGLTMEPRFQEREKEFAIGLADSFPQDSTQKIGQLWDKFQSRMAEIENVKPGYALGICLFSHPDVIKKADDSFVYAAAVPVKSVAEVPKGLSVFEIPSGKYAVFTHKGPIQDIRHTVNYIWGTWIPKNIENYNLSDGPDFELYDERFDPKTLSGEVDIYVLMR